MGIYSRHVFPRLLSVFMAGENFARIRRELLSSARGEVLEIGVGSGLNLPHYPASIEGLTGIDVNPGMRRLAARQCRRFAREPELLATNAQAVPVADETFDTVVSTWTLCSVGAVTDALSEIRRVMKSDGRFLFVEHGLSPDPNVRNWQRRLTPLQRRIADGCHLNRDIPRLVAAAGLRIERMESFYMDGVPRVAGWLYAGFAERSESDSDP